MPSFAVSIVFLTLVQAAVVAVPGAPPRGVLDRVRSRWWALVPPASIIVVIGCTRAPPMPSRTSPLWRCRHSPRSRSEP